MSHFYFQGAICNIQHMAYSPELLAKTLLELMREHEMSANQLAEKLALPQPTITRITSGETTKPRIDTLCKLAEFFHVSVSQLIGEAPLHADPALVAIEMDYHQMSAQKRNTVRSIVHTIASEPDAP